MSNHYPTVFIHGLGGWGETDKASKFFPYFGSTPSKNMIQHVREEGYEVYQPSLGPVTSAWDRCCELWAQLVGGTVDYGKVHSQRHGHARYGRTYEKGLIADWGTPGDHAKINVVGHSFGGPVVKQFAELIANGCQEEVNGTPEEELSGLFKIEKPQKIHCVTTLSGVNNGTTMASLMGNKGMTVITYAILIANALVGQTRVMDFYDFHTDHWGVMPDPSTVTKHKFTNPLKKKASYAAYDKNFVDSCAREMMVETVQDMVNPSQRTNPKYYYFVYRAARQLKDMFFLCGAAGKLTGKIQEEKLACYGVDASWKEQDGFVNVPGQSAPFNQPYADFPGEESIEPGIWYNMPVEDKDHMSWMGFGEPKDKYFAEYEVMLKRFAALPDVD